MDFLFLTRMSTLKVGKLRYGFLLTEGGAVFDDGVVLRLADDRFVVSSSSSHVSAVTAHFEEWRQDRFKLDRVVIHDTTPHWATFAVAGPQSKALVATLGLGIDLDDKALPHMAMAEGHYEGRQARIARVSFVGERSYEISVPAKLAGKLWRVIRELGAEPLGIEGLSILRAEKGYILVGVDTDGETLPHDIGFGAARDKRQDAYVGDRSLFTQRAKRNDRPQLVGIASPEVIPTGAHAVEKTASGERSVGFISTSVMSPTLNRPIALALIERGQNRLGEELSFEYLGRRLKGTIAPACFYDPEGKRLHV